MVSCHDPFRLALVVISLRIDSTQPPSGELKIHDHAGTAFNGWLDLLRVLSEAMKPPEGPFDGAPLRP